MGTDNKRCDYLVTFFVENRLITKLLSELIKNKTNQYYIQTLGLPVKFSIPFFQEEINGSYIFKKDFSSDYEVLLNGAPCNQSTISSGDYYTFNDKYTIIKVLFVATSDIQVGYDKYNLEKNTNIFIGRSSSNDISYGLNDFVSREKHVAIHVDSNGETSIEDLKRSVGVYLNGYLVHSHKLNLFDEVYIMGLSIIYMGDFIAVRHLKTNSALTLTNSFPLKMPITNKNIKYFVTTPRILKSLDNDVIEIDAPPNPVTLDKTPILLTIGPSVTMALVMLGSLCVTLINAIRGGQIVTVITSGVMAVGSLIGSVLWPYLLKKNQKKSIDEAEHQRKESYIKYISNIENNLIQKKDRSIRILNNILCPSPDILCSMLNDEGSKLHLWERSYEDEDFLDIRLGLGDRPFGVELKIPKQGFNLHEDSLRELPAELSKKYSTLKNVPITLDILHNQTIGIIGNQKNIRIILEELILNVIALHSYDEVKLVILASNKCVYDFKDYKNIPHMWSDDKKIRFYATNPDETHLVLNTINGIITERYNTKLGKDKYIPHFVIIVTDPYLIEKESLLRCMNDGNNVGITTIYAYGDITKLPKACKTIIQSDETSTGYYIKNKNANKFIPFTLDQIENKQVHSFIKELSRLPIKRDLRALGIVDRISFLEMYKVGNTSQLNIESHWDNNHSDKSLAAPIGVVSGGEVFSLDLHEAYHGCHGLVAGTTGSGKSEFLQALILSLSINYSPNEVAFVLIDFKGGDMARPFMKKPFAPALPHLSATISNLSGNILYRALVSLNAEIKYRQNLFNSAASVLGVDKIDINSYQRYYKGGRLITPLPHLVIIIDEFAQLKKQQPEFLTKLIDIAQVGRSLGIHLILATQKPGGIVDPQIMSNSRFKVCLKVADKQDSVDMLNKPDAAKIKNPGRLYLQVGYDEIYECMQSGYSGAKYIPTDTYIKDEDITVHMTDNTSQPIYSSKIDFPKTDSDKSQLEAIVSEIVTIGIKKNLAAKPLWLDVLPETVVLSSLSSDKKGLCDAIVGLADYIQTQEQKPFSIDFVKNGHVALYGASGTGKTTFIQTLVYSMIIKQGYTPEELNIYAMDFGGRNLNYLSVLPHTGGVVFADDESKILGLMYVLQGIIEDRKNLFSKNNCGTFSDYRAVCKKKIPAILVLIDNYASFREQYLNIAESFTDLISFGKTFGIYFVITGSTRNSIYYKVTDHIATNITFKMNDPSSYMDILSKRSQIIPEDIRGRGITLINGEVIEFQTAIANDKGNEAQRLVDIKNQYMVIASRWNGYVPQNLDGVKEEESNVVTEINTNIYSSSEEAMVPKSIVSEAKNLVLGSSKSNGLEYGIDLSEEYKVCICADSTYDLSKIYKTIVDDIFKYEDRIAFVIDSNYMLKNIADKQSRVRYLNGSEAFNDFIEEIRSELNRRLEESDLQHQKIFILIPEFNEFFEMITDEQAAFMRKVLHYINDPKYGIYFICGFNVEGNKSNDRLYMSLIVHADNYIFCPQSYEIASTKIENAPIIKNADGEKCYVSFKGKNIEIRW